MQTDNATQTEAERIAAGLSEAQRRALSAANVWSNGRWVIPTHDGRALKITRRTIRGLEVRGLVSLYDLTDEGLAVRRIIEGTKP